MIPIVVQWTFIATGGAALILAAQIKAYATEPMHETGALLAILTSAILFLGAVVSADWRARRRQLEEARNASKRNQSD